MAALASAASAQLKQAVFFFGSSAHLRPHGRWQRYYHSGHTESRARVMVSGSPAKKPEVARRSSSMGSVNGRIEISG